MKEALSSSETSVLTESRGVTSQKTPFFVVTAMKTSSLTFFHLADFQITENTDVSVPESASVFRWAEEVAYSVVFLRKR
jgi:hypothetical protein